MAAAISRSTLVVFVCPRNDWHQELLPPVQPPQRLFRGDALAKTVHIEGVVLAVPGEGAIAQCAQAVDVAAPIGGVDLADLHDRRGGMDRNTAHATWSVVRCSP
jgi:hypothetical protein